MRYFVLLTLAAVAVTGAHGVLIGKKGGIAAAELVGAVVAKAIAIALAHLKVGRELPIGLLQEGYHGINIHHQNGIPYSGEHPLWRREAGAEPDDDDDEIVTAWRREAGAEPGDDDDEIVYVERRDADAEADAEAEADAYDDEAGLERRDADAGEDDDAEASGIQRRFVPLLLKKKLLLPKALLLG